MKISYVVHLIVCILVFYILFWHIRMMKPTTRTKHILYIEQLSYVDTDTNETKIGHDKSKIKSINVKKGDILIIQNNDTTRNAIACSDPLIPNSHILHEKSKYVIIFEKKGQYKLISTLYGSMDQLTVNVK